MVKLKEYKAPYIIQFEKLGNPTIGYISVGQNDKMPFEIKRVFWTYFTPESVIRGRHAHYETEQILIAASGKIVVNVEQANGEIDKFILEDPSVGIYLPPNVWHTIQYSHISTQLVLASSIFEEEDYIRSYDEFRKVWGR